MKKRVLVLSSSPRREGNSDQLCSRFVAGAQEAGHEVEKVVLRDEEIAPCRACDGCRHTGVCVQRDDMAAILDRMLAADVIVLATPVYFYSMSAQMKTLIDRTYACWRRLTNKDFYFILTAAVESRDRLGPTLEGLRGFTSCLEGAKEKGVLFGTGLWEKHDVEGSPLLDEAFEMGRAVS